MNCVSKFTARPYESGHPRNFDGWTKKGSGHQCAHAFVVPRGQVCIVSYFLPANLWPFTKMISSIVEYSGTDWSIFRTALGTTTKWLKSSKTRSISLFIFCVEQRCWTISFTYIFQTSMNDPHLLLKPFFTASFAKPGLQSLLSMFVGETSCSR